MEHTNFLRPWARALCCGTPESDWTTYEGWSQWGRARLDLSGRSSWCTCKSLMTLTTCRYLYTQFTASAVSSVHF